MGFENTDSDFDAFLAALAHAPGAPVQSQHLPRAVPSATLIDGRYRVERLAGTGGMGEVYQATDESLNRPVALKLARARLGGAAQRRWQGEARALARLSHPNVVQVFRVGMDHETPFIVMEWVCGRTLAQWASERDRPWTEVVSLYQQAAEGLAAAHAMGIVHRDFKPHNVLLGEDGRVRVADFGLAALDTNDAVTPFGAPGSGDTAGPMGTRGYIAPEVLRGGTADARSDQYSFCVALHEALTGTLPPVEREVHGHRLPYWLVDVLRIGLRTDPAQRHASVAVIARALGEKRRRARRRREVAVYAGMAAFGVGVVSDLSGDEPPPCEVAAAELGSFWNDTRRETLRRALEDTGSSLAQSVAPAVLDAIDAKATQWAAQRVSACESPQSSEKTAHLACLARSRMQIEAALAVLDRPDRETVARARELVSVIEPPSGCDSESSRRGVAVSSEEERELQKAIAEVNALRVSGRQLEARDRADDLLLHANSPPRLITEGLLARGLAYAEAEGHGRGVEDLQFAYWNAMAQHQDALAAEASRSVVLHLVTEASTWDEAQRWANLALAAERRLGLSAPSWRLLRARAKAARAAQRFEPAHRDYEAALEAAKDARPSDRIDLLNSLSGLLQGEYRLDESLRRAQEAVALAEGHLPYDSPLYADSLVSVGMALERRGDYTNAIDAIAQALEIRRRVLDPSATPVTEALSVLAGTLAVAGRLDEALAAQDEALDLATARAAPDETEVASNLTVKGRILFELGRFDEAEVTLERAALAHEEATGATSIDRAYALMLLGVTRLEQRDFEGDLDAQTRALDVLRQVVAPDSPQIAGALANRATALLVLERPQDASDDLDTAMEILTLAGEERGILGSMVLAMQAEAHAQRGDSKRATQLALEALALDRALSPEASSDLVRAYSTAADTLMLVGELDQAEKLVREGLATLDALEPMDHLRGKLVLDLAKIALRRGDRGALRQRCRAGAKEVAAGWAREEITAWCESNGVSTD